MRNKLVLIFFVCLVPSLHAMHRTHPDANLPNYIATSTNIAEDLRTLEARHTDITRVLTSNKVHVDFHRTQLWEHTIGTGLCLATLASMHRAGDIDPTVAFGVMLLTGHHASLLLHAARQYNLYRNLEITFEEGQNDFTREIERLLKELERLKSEEKKQ